MVKMKLRLKFIITGIVPVLVVYDVQNAFNPFALPNFT